MGEQGDLEGSLTTLRATLTAKEQERLEKKVDLKRTMASKKKLEEYLAGITPGCDFMDQNFELRIASRAKETAALESAKRLVKGTPAYSAALTAARHESFGACRSKCVGNEANVMCKACLSGVSIPAYCAGHPGTVGCL